MPRPAHRTTPPRAASLARALARFQAGRFDEAAAQCAALLNGAPDESAALHLLGLARLKAGQTGEAVVALRRAAAAEPGNAEIAANLGAALRAAGDPAGAIGPLRRAVALRPAFFPARYGLGRALAALGRTAEAATAYRDALALDSRHVGARHALGRMLFALDLPAEAEAEFRAALDGSPDDGVLRGERGVALIALDRLPEGVAELEKAASLAPDDPAVLANLGSALCVAGRAKEALAPLTRADALAPGTADTLANLGHALKQFGRLNAAVAAYDRALAAEASNREARFGRGFCRLLQGDFAAGWSDYRARESMAGAGPELWRDPLPDDLSGKRILVVHDQGIGDEIFFLRFLSTLKARGAQAMYLPDPRLAAMIARSQLSSTVGCAADAGRCDFTLSVGDLPAVLGATGIPPSVSLRPLRDREAALAMRLAAFGPPPYIGVAWRAGTPNRKNQLYKEMPLGALAQALRPLDARIVVVQRRPKAGEPAAFAEALGRQVLDLSAVNDDLEAMLALVGLLDEQVCVSNTNVHLAAARGRRCRVLVPHPPEFRWMASGAESPWFPGMPVYRQAPDGDWQGAFAALARDLAATVRAGG